MKLDLRVFTAALLTLAVLLAMVPAAAEKSLPLQIVNPNVTIVVKSVEYKLRVYPDGSVQPVYKLDAIVKGVMAKDLEAELESKSSATSSSYSSSSILEAVLPLKTLKAYSGSVGVPTGFESSATSLGKVKIVVSMDSRYTLGPGFTSEGGASVRISNSSMEAVIAVNYTLSVSKRGSYVLDALLVFRGVNATLVNKMLPAIKMLLENLTRLGLVSDWSVGTTWVGKAPALRVSIRGSISVLAAGLLALGVSPTDVSQVLTLLEKSYGIRGHYTLELSLKLEEGVLKVKVKTGSRAEGRIGEYFLDVARASNAVSKILLALAVSMLRKEGYNVPLAAVTLASQEPLAQKPPFQASVKINVEGEEDGVKIRVDYTGPKLIYAYPTGDPASDAAKTLQVIAKRLSNTYAVLKILALTVPGVDKLLPPEVVVEGVDGVTVSPSMVPSDQLDNTVFTVMIRHVATTTSSTTTTRATTTTPSGASKGSTRTTATSSPSPTTTHSIVGRTTSTPAGTSTMRSATMPPRAQGGGNNLAMLLLAVVVAALVGGGVAYLLSRR